MKSRPASPDVRSLLYEKLDAMLADCDHIIGNAAYGRTVHDMDDFLFVAGRQFINEVFQHKLQERIEQVESTDESKQCPKCKKNAHARPTPEKYSHREQPCHHSSPHLPLFSL